MMPPEISTDLRPPVSTAEADFQDALLPGVSRTFALTIPELPGCLRQVVTNLYLLCRIADTIEDEPALSPEEKRRFQARFAAAVAGEADGDAFARELRPRLSQATKTDERELVAHTARVLSVTHGFPGYQREHLVRCILTMSEGMADFQCSRDERSGLPDQKAMDRYCYCVAGVVGETLTELFCQHSDAIAANKARLLQLSVSFGQGLQMTNILKDVWDDRVRGFCWLPREVFLRKGFDLDTMDRGQRAESFGSALQELVGLAHGHLRNALSYVLLIPPHEQGIRRFCLWALGMAVLTLRKVHRHRARFATGREVKISRRAVRATVVVSNLSARWDALLLFLFRLSSVGLPSVEPSHATN